MDKEDLHQLYVVERLSQRKIAQRHGVSQTTVRHYLKKFDIERNEKRPHSSKELKTCPSCGEAKEGKMFYQRKEGGLSSWCRQCNGIQVVERQRRYKAEAVDYKGGCCQSCGFNKYLGALEFHHLDPTTKSGDIVRFSRGLHNQDVKEEVDKCVLLCANCHRMIHAGIIGPQDLTYRK